MTSYAKALAVYAKALTAAALTAIAFAVPVIDNGLIPSEVLGIIAAALTGGTLVWRVPNADPGE